MSGKLQDLIVKNPDNVPEGAYGSDAELEEIPTPSDEDEDPRTTAEKLYQISEATNDDGTVDVEITDWGEETTRSGKPRGNLYVEFWTATEGTERETMPLPKRDETDYKFVRLVENMGLSLRAAMVEAAKDEDMGDVLVGQTVKADPDDWSLVAPEPKPRHEQLWANTWGSRRAKRCRAILRYFSFHVSAITFIVSGVLLLAFGGNLLGLICLLSFAWLVVNFCYGNGSD